LEVVGNGVGNTLVSGGFVGPAAGLDRRRAFLRYSARSGLLRLRYAVVVDRGMRQLRLASPTVAACQSSLHLDSGGLVVVVRSAPLPVVDDAVTRVGEHLIDGGVLLLL